MRPDNAVPDVQLLKRFLLGQLSAVEAEPVERYLESHPDIASTLSDLAKEDTLIGSLRASVSHPADETPELADLMDRLSQLRPVGDDTFPGLAPPQRPDELGRLGGYRILGLLGAGGMGMVYQAEDVQLQRLVALKVMKPEVARSPMARERFLREARAAARLKSDHVVTIHHVGQDRQVVYLAMELLDGLSLDDWLKKGRKPTLAQAARIGRQIALGLAAAHARGLMHRDVKPGNIWLESSHQGRVKLLDFGLVRGEGEEVALTQSGDILGTPAYMAPEQARGEKVDPRADLFSLGVVLYRLTTGQLPFRGESTMALLTSLAVDTPRPPRDIDAAIPPRLASLIERLLAKDREQRPSSARAVAEELAAIEREVAQPDVPTVQTVRAASVSERGALAPPTRSRSRLGWLVAASLLLVLGGAALAIIVIIRDRQGNTIAETKVPEGGSVEIRDDGKGKEVKGPPAEKESTKSAGAPLAPRLPGQPLSPVALVREPARLPGVRSWTIEPRVLKQPLCMAYRSDGKRLAVGTYDGRIHIWEPQTGRLIQVLLLDGPRTSVCSLAWVPGGRVLAAGLGGDRPIRLWDAETGRPFAAPESLGLEIERIDLLAWSPDGRNVLAYSSNPPYSLAWSGTDGKLLRKVEVANGPPPQTPAVLAPDGKRLWGKGSDSVVVWDMETGKEIDKVSGPRGDLRGLALSADGKRLAWGADDGLHRWELASGKEIVSNKLAPHRGFPIECSWSPDGRCLDFASPGLGHIVVEAGSDYAMRWEQVFYHPSPRAWSPDSKTLAVYDNSGAVCLLDAGNGKRLRTLSGEFTSPFGQMVDCSLSADGRTLALTDDTRAVLAATDTGQPVVMLDRAYHTATWSPNGKSLAACLSDGTVILWEDNGKIRIPLKGHRSRVYWLAWSPDGRRLASSSGDEKRVLIWDAQKGEQLCEAGPFPARAEWPTWSPDGQLLAFRVPGAGWHIWNVDRNKLVNDPRQWDVPLFEFAADSASAIVAIGPDQPYRLRSLITGKDCSTAGADCTCARTDPNLSLSPDGRLLAAPLWSSDIALLRSDLRGRVRALRGVLTPFHTWRYEFSRDGKLLAGVAGEYVHLWETETGRLRGIVLPRTCYNSLTLTPAGHYTGNEQVERGIVMVVQKDDGTQEVLEPADFEQKYGWKNEPDRVHLLQPLPPPLYPQPGMPMGPNALVREPAELPEVNSWTIETVNPRGLVRAVAYRPDGKLLATGGADGVVRIWDTAGRKLVRIVIATHPVDSLSWSKDGTMLAAGGEWENPSLWEVNTGRLLQRLPGARWVAWSPDGKSIALGVADGVQVWDVAAQRVAHQHRYAVNPQALAWSPDGKLLAVGLLDKTVRLWDVASWKETHTLEGHESQEVRGIAWSPDGKRLVTASNMEHQFHVWDAARGKLEGRFVVPQVGAYPAVAWSPDGKHVAVDQLGLFDPDTGRHLRPLELRFGVLGMAFSPDGNQLATAGPDGVCLHDASGKRTHTLEEGMGHGRTYYNKLTWSPDGRRLALGFAPLRVVEAATGRRRASLPEAHHLASWSPDGRLLAAKGTDNSLRLWDAVTLRPLRMMDFGGHTSSLGLGMMAWPPDGKMLAAGGESHLLAWSAETGKLLWHKDQDSVAALAWSPDGARLASSEWRGDAVHPKGVVRIWQGDNGKLLHEAPLPALRLAWSPDGKKLALWTAREQEGGVRSSVALMDAASGKLLARGPENIAGTALDFHWSSDGKTFATLHQRSGSASAAVCVWDGGRCALLRNTPLPVVPPTERAAWSPDGRWLGCAGDSEVYLHTADGQLLGVLLPFDAFSWLALTPDGHYRGNARLERQIRMVVQKSDGGTETLTPAEFEQRCGFKNDPAQVRLIEP